MADSDSRYKIITGDFNAKIGTKAKEEGFKSRGAFGTGKRNERGDRLIEFAEEHNLIIANTLLQKQKQKQNKTKKPQTNKTNKNPPNTGLGSHPMEKQETK